MKWYLIINPKLFHYYSKNYGDWEYFFIFISLNMSYSKNLISTVITTDSIFKYMKITCKK